MSTKRQLWRRQSRKVHRLPPERVFAAGLEVLCVSSESSCSIQIRAVSDPCMSQETVKFLHRDTAVTRSSSENSFCSNGKISESNIRKIILNDHPVKTVTFGSIESIILIPSRSEYRSIYGDESLWWEKNEMQGFKENALFELCQLMKACSISADKAKYLLYQIPNL